MMGAWELSYLYAAASTEADLTLEERETEIARGQIAYSRSMRASTSE